MLLVRGKAMPSFVVRRKEGWEEGQKTSVIRIGYWSRARETQPLWYDGRRGGKKGMCNSEMLPSRVSLRGLRGGKGGGAGRKGICHKSASRVRVKQVRARIKGLMSPSGLLHSKALIMQ